MFIIITAPLGGVLIGLTGRKWLEKGSFKREDENEEADDKYNGGVPIEHMYLSHVIPGKTVKVVVVSKQR